MDARDRGFDWSELSSDCITRRSMLKLLTGSAAGLSALSVFDAPPVSSAATPGGHLIGAWNFDAIKLLDPAYMNVVEQMQVASNIFSGLVYVDVGLVVKPELAEKWEVSKDGLTWTFQLRKGVVFHNGQKFNADDVEYTYKRTTDPKVASIHKSRLDIVEKFEKLGEYEVRLKLTNPSAAFLMSTLSRVPARAMTIVCRTALEKMGKDAYNIMPVGTGPFRVTKHQIGSDIVLEKNPDYFVSGLPKLDKVTIKMVPESSTQVNALRAGDIQFLNKPPVALLDQLLADSNMKIEETPDPGTWGLFLQQANVPQFRDKRVRQAIAKAINKETVVEKAYMGRAIPMYEAVNPAQTLYYRGNTKETSPQRYNPEEAQKLWREAGMPKGFKIKVMCADFLGFLRVAQVIKPMIDSTLGTDVEVMQMDPAIFHDRHAAGKYEASILGTGMDFDPNDSLDDVFGTKSKFNNFAYSNPKVDELLKQQFEEGDLQKRIKMVHQISDIVTEDAPWAFLVHHLDLTAMHKAVGGYVKIPALRELAYLTLS